MSIVPLSLRGGRRPTKQSKVHNIVLRLHCSLCSLAMTMLLLGAAAHAMELPPEAKEYYKDKVSSAPGNSEGVGPTAKPTVQEGVDIGRRETKEFDFSDESSSTLSAKAFEALNKKDEASVLAYTSRCIELYKQEAREQGSALKDFAKPGSEEGYQELNNVAASYFILGEFYSKQKKDWEKAKAAYQKVIDDFYFAQYWDPRGWWWKPSEISKGEIEKIDAGYYESKEEYANEAGKNYKAEGSQVEMPEEEIKRTDTEHHEGE